MLGLFKDLLLYQDAIYIPLAYPCIYVMFLLCFLFCDDHPWWEQMEEILGVGLVVAAVQLRGLVCVTLWSSPGPECLFCNFML